MILRLSRFLSDYGFGYLLLYGVLFLQERLYHWELSTVMILGFTIIAIDLVTTSFPHITAWVYVKRISVAFIALCGCSAASLILLASHPPQGPDSQSVITLINFGLQGFVVGVLVRMLIRNMISRMLRGASVQFQRLILMMGVSVFVWLFPHGEVHYLGSLYVLGFGIGFFIHFLFRNSVNNQARNARIYTHISTMLDTLDEDFKPYELEAIRLFSKHNWTRFDRILSDHDDSLPPSLAILKAYKHRIKGDYPGALDTVNRELEVSKRPQRFDSVLYLHQGLAFGELGDVEKTLTSLNKAIEADPECLLAKAAKSLRLAEQISLREDYSDSLGAKESLAEMWDTLKISETKPRRDVFKAMLESPGKVGWTFLLDAYGYVLLKSGRHQFCRSLLMHCIFEDPDFSSPYLHLAEWHIKDSYGAQALNDKGRLLQDRSVALLCLHIALYFEGKRDSLIVKRARAFLKELNPHPEKDLISEGGLI